MSAEPKVPLAVHCYACGHVWAAIWLPVPVSEIPKRYNCPLCFEKKRIFMASADAAYRIPQPLICEVPNDEHQRSRHAVPNTHGSGALG